MKRARARAFLRARPGEASPPAAVRGCTSWVALESFPSRDLTHRQTGRSRPETPAGAPAFLAAPVCKRMIGHVLEGCKEFRGRAAKISRALGRSSGFHKPDGARRPVLLGAEVFSGLRKILPGARSARGGASGNRPRGRADVSPARISA